MISADELKELMESGEDYVLLDCRSEQAYEAEHMVSAVCLPWREIAERAEEVIPSKEALVITSCSSLTCDASEKCFEALAKQGYTNLREYAGGLADWKARGYKAVLGGSGEQD